MFPKYCQHPNSITKPTLNEFILTSPQIYISFITTHLPLDTWPFSKCNAPSKNTEYTFFLHTSVLKLWETRQMGVLSFENLSWAMLSSFDMSLSQNFSFSPYPYFLKFICSHQMLPCSSSWELEYWYKLYRLKMYTTFLYTVAMMAVRTRIPTRKHLWKYWCRISDWTSALTNIRTARMYPRYWGIFLSLVKVIKALKPIKHQCIEHQIRFRSDVAVAGCKWALIMWYCCLSKP